MVPSVHRMQASVPVAQTWCKKVKKRSKSVHLSGSILPQSETVSQISGVRLKGRKRGICVEMNGERRLGRTSFLFTGYNQAFHLSQFAHSTSQWF